MSDCRLSTVRRYARITLPPVPRRPRSGSAAVGSRSVAFHDATETRVNAHNGVAMHMLLRLSAVGPLLHVCFCCMLCKCEEKKQCESGHAYVRYSTARACLLSPSFSHYVEENESCEMVMEGGRRSARGHDAHNGFVLFTHCGNVAAPRSRCVASQLVAARILRPRPVACICSAWSSVSLAMRLYVA